MGPVELREKWSATLHSGPGELAVLEINRTRRSFPCIWETKTAHQKRMFFPGETKCAIYHNLVVAKLAVGVAARAVDASSTTTKHLSWFDLVW